MSKRDDQSIKRSTEAAIASVRSMLASGSLNGRAALHTLSDTEWGWIVCSIVFSWIKSKAEYAATEGLESEIEIRKLGREPEPWEAGAVQSILPALGGIDRLDWAKPVGDWSKEEIIGFAWHCHRSIDAALARQREASEPAIIRRPYERLERELTASNGGPLMTQDELQEAF